MLILELEHDETFHTSKAKLILDIAGARTIVASGQVAEMMAQRCIDDAKAGKFEVKVKKPAKVTKACY
jgi:hypothetical protein